MDTVTERIAPGLDVTVQLALALGLVDLNAATRRVALSELGATVSGEIEDDPDLLTLEKEYLGQFGRISDAAVSKRLRGGS